MARVASASPSADGNAIGTSPPPPTNKRDKKRQQLSEKLTEIISAFSANRDQHCRAQLQALQVDMNLVLAGEPYRNNPLTDSGTEIDVLVDKIMNGTVPPDDAVGSDYKALVGKHYSKFAGDANDLLEERDAQITATWERYHTDFRDVKTMNHFHKHVALQEHRALSETLRERLMTMTSNKRSKLQREKDQLDISESNAFLLHPNQFNLTNPSSPGGIHSNRKTRHTRHRVLDPDDLTSAVAAQENKRKRKAAFEEDDTTAIGGRYGESSGGLVPHTSKVRNLNGAHQPALYSIDRLFTEKELNLNMNHATLASRHFFQKLKMGNLAENSDQAGNGTPVHIDEDMGGTGMERTVSQTHHATRGATRNGLTDLAAVAESSAAFPYSVPPIVAIPITHNSRNNQNAPSPPSLGAGDVEQDLALMKRSLPFGDPSNDRLLAVATATPTLREYELGGPETIDRTVDSLLAPGNHVGGVPMSAQNSNGGASELGGVPMSRTGNGSSLGGVGMRRTASGRGRRG